MINEFIDVLLDENPEGFQNYLEGLINHDLELWQQIIMFYNSSFRYTGELGPEGAY